MLLAYEAGNGPRPARVARVWVTNPPVGHLFEAQVVLSEGLGSATAAGSKDVVTGWTHVSGCRGVCVRVRVRGCAGQGQPTTKGG